MRYHRLGLTAALGTAVLAWHLRETYLHALEQCAPLAAADGGMASQIDQFVAVILDAAHADTKKQFTNDEFDQGVQFLRDFAARRPQQALNEVARIRKGQ